MDAGNSAFQVFSEEWKHICESNPDELRRGDLQRLHQMFAVLMGEEKPKYDLPLVQRPYSFYMPKLTAKPIWDACAFEVVSRLERDFQVIREELLCLLDGWNRNSRETSAGDNASPSGFKEYMGDGGSKDQGRMTTSGLWKVFYFYHNFVEVEENFAKCPKTGSILRQLVAADLLLGGMLFATDDQVTGARLKSGDQYVDFQMGKCFVFDDSFIHEVWHRGVEPRASLMLDLWHPDVTKIERVLFLRAMHNAVSKMGRSTALHSTNIYKPKDYSDIDAR